MRELLQPLASSSGIHGPLCLENAIEEIMMRIRENEEKRNRLIKTLLKLPAIQGPGLQENFLKKKIPLPPGEAQKVVGVDGGMLELNLHGIDILLLRAVAVKFHYLRGRLEKAEYIPSGLPTPKIIATTEPIDHLELQMLAGMERQLTEIQVAIDAADDADALLLDGSIVPQYVDRFSRKSCLFMRYMELVAAYASLYKKCLEKGILLAGVVKDSRGSRFTEILKGNLGEKAETLEHSRDTVILDGLLEVGERTACFGYVEEPAGHVLQDLGELGRKVSVIYLKVASFDRPTRVEFIWDDDPSETAEHLSSLILSISSHHQAFGIPTVLVEADRLARLGEEELEPVVGRIADVAGEEAMKLRRERRPF
ncbi:MAG: DNA double-strand break repair nuclease NurA [Candidatus Hadarchaeales archaeon]